MEFFPRQRRRTTLKDWSPKHNNEDEKRIRLNFLIVLSGNITGIPDFVNDGFVAIEKEGARIGKVCFETELEGVTLDIYETPEANKKTLLLPAATLRQFTLLRKDEKTVLAFNTTVPRSKDLLHFADKYEDCDMFIAFDATQAKLVFTSDEDDPNQTKLGFKDKDPDEEEDDTEDKEVEKVAKNFGVNQKRIARELPAKAAKGKR
jgi:hypothetical protein